MLTSKSVVEKVNWKSNSRVERSRRTTYVERLKEYGMLSGARENKRKKETAEQFGAYLYIPFLTDNIPDPAWLHSHPNKWRRISVYEAILL